ncbi:MAG: translation initiation factor [Candidatus Neomarinimicrobiota bacterium]|tara:strand:- start:1180 stop:1509 length:330 start_codon:yes stop_codon:yes gene_type:complete
MKKNKNIVFSTDDNFFIEENTPKKVLLMPNEKQNLKVLLKRLPGNRILTVVAGFQGNDKTLVKLSKMLKKLCGVGGSVKNNQILIQGKHREKIMNILIERGFKVKASGG